MPSSRLAVDVPPSAGADEIRELCFLKQSTFNTHLCPSQLEVMDYILSFKDMSPATFLPGTSEPLTLQVYKEALGLPFSQVTFVMNCVGCLDEGKASKHNCV